MKKAQVYKVKCDEGYMLFKLELLLEKHNLSVYRFVKDLDIANNTATRYIKGTIVRIDIDVLSKMCNYFNCSINDIVEYVKEVTVKN